IHRIAHVADRIDGLDADIIFGAACQAQARRAGAGDVADIGEGLHIGSAGRRADCPLVTGDTAAGVAEATPVRQDCGRGSLEVDVAARTVAHGAGRRRRAVHRYAVGTGRVTHVAYLVHGLDADVVLGSVCQAQARGAGARSEI